MTQSQTVTVDQQEILNRANEVEAPMADPPTDVPITPCELTAAKNAAQQLVLSADNMREYLAAGAKERQRLATSLRNAAKAYGEVDEEAATALDNDGEGTVQAESAGAVGGDSSAELTDTPRVATAGEPNFMDLKEAARKLETGDQGASLAHFADGWNTFNLTLQGDVKRFRGFDNWEGDAATACEASLDQQRQWILHMAKLSAAMAKQAQYVAQLRVWARREHPTYEDIVGRVGGATWCAGPACGRGDAVGACPCGRIRRVGDAGCGVRCPGRTGGGRRAERYRRGSGRAFERGYGRGLGRGVACCHWAGAGGYLGQGGGTEHAGGLGADGTSCPPAVDRSHRQTRSQRVCR